MADSLEKVFESAEATQEMVLDIETNSMPVWHSDFQVVGIGIASNDDTYYASRLDEMYKVAVYAWQYRGLLIGHNFGFDMQGCKKFFNLPDYPAHPVCTMIAMNLIDENLGPKEIGLKPTVKRLFDYEMMTFDEATEGGMSSPLFAQYCMDDCRQTHRLWEWEKEKLVEEEVVDFFFKISMPTLKVVSDMELVGMQWDWEACEELIDLYKAKQDEIEWEIRDEIGEHGFVKGKTKKIPIVPMNLNSRLQLAELLFEKLGMSSDGLDTTPTGRIKLDAKALDLLAKRHPICKKFWEYSHCTKMISTYLIGPSEYALKDFNSRIHPNTWLTSTTGRMRQTKPAGQTIPKVPYFDPDEKTYKVRRCIIPRPGYVFAQADFSQFQLRLCAHVTGDKVMTEAYTHWKCTKCNSDGFDKKLLLKCPKCGQAADEGILKDPTLIGFWHGEDLHQKTYESVDAIPNRVQAKICNFGLLFGAKDNKMNQEFPEFSKRQWKKMIDGFFQLYKGLQEYHWRLESQLKGGDLTLRTVFGRKRRIPKKEIERSFWHSLNQAYNSDIQISEVAYACLAFSQVREDLIACGLYGDGSLRNNKVNIVQLLHDEIVLEVPDYPEIREKVEDIVLNAMRYRVQLNVPVDADIKWIKSWAG